MSESVYKLIASIPSLKTSQVFVLEKGRRYLIGSAEMEPGMLVFSIDRSMSRRQAWLEIVDEVLHVERHPNASQSLNDDPAIKTLQLAAGETFTAGLTVFQFLISQEDSAAGVSELTYTLSSRDFAAALKEHSTRHFLEVVSEMPALMQKNETPADFLRALCGSLQNHVPSLKVTVWGVRFAGDWPEVFPLGPSSIADPSQEIVGNALPSRRLMKQAFASGDEECVVSFWNRHSGAGSAASSMVTSGAEWAMCIPISLAEHEHFALYATSHQMMMPTEQREIQQILAALGTMAKQHLLAARTKERQGQIGQFFSPALRSILFGDLASAEQVLRPGEYEATICFFDLRGSSRLVEAASGEPKAYFTRLEKLLGEATRAIFDTGGIVIDFQGDAILACWGVPPLGASAKPARQAAIAAQRIVELMVEYDWPEGESKLRCGIGITCGKVLAGLFAAQSAGQILLSKYSVMGPVVNQAARLESMAKQFGVPILVDHAVAEAL
ncbi:MAG: adenylate/guanylate cyclase domain-containing protein, partial [candidate division KSB1 bacterium]|nr:adenylate/guanylate cyclase domain-containing protein [candidate division KSB1 bacterium]